MCLASRVRSCDGATLIRRRLGILPTNLGGAPARRLGRAAIAFARDSSAARPRSMDANLFFYTIERKHPAVQVEGDVQPGFKVGRSRVDRFKKKAGGSAEEKGGRLFQVAISSRLPHCKTS